MASRPRSLVVLLIAALLTVAALGCGSDDSSSGSADSGQAIDTEAQDTSTSRGSGEVQSGEVEIDIADFEFKPPEVTVEAGTKVTWTNKDSANHTATADDKTVFDTGNLNQGDAKSATLDKAGTYGYICDIHPYMKGSVTVK
ncbi:MAG: cupredoxin domain-containing protein [Solirubrobacterales bacterium]